MIRLRFSTISAITLSAAFLAGCGGDAATRAPLSRDPGPAPAYLQPVTVAAPAVKTSPVVDADRQEAGKDIANAIIVCAREDWDRMRERMVKGDASPDAAPAADCAEATAARSKPKPKRRKPGG